MKRALLLALCALALGPVTEAHYNLKYPMPYNRIQCNVPRCQGPCPPIWTSGNAKARNSPANPSATWRRGQKVTIEWHRNNHEGGFYRRSLVPVKHMNSKAWHKKLAFDWGCFAQGRFMCGKASSCGTDHKGFAFRNQMTVPEVFPDGDYVFAQLWYGGLHWRRKVGFFSDYHTCAFVRIRGGAFADAHKPTFVPGRNDRPGVNVAPGKCASTSTFINQCGGGPCKGNPVRDSVPGEFMGGKSPPSVLRSFLGGQVGMSKAQPKAASTVGEQRAVVDDAEAAQEDQKIGIAEAQEDKKMVGKKWNSKKWNTKNSGQNNWQNKMQNKSQNNVQQNAQVMSKCGLGPVPPKQSGSWGMRFSAQWRRERAIWMKRRAHCQQCKQDC